MSKFVYAPAGQGFVCGELQRAATPERCGPNLRPQRLQVQTLNTHASLAQPFEPLKHGYTRRRIGATVPHRV